MNIENRFSVYAEKSSFSGNISIFKQQKSIYRNSFGFRDLANKTPNDENTRFGIASGTKLFTALGIIKLVEGGSLALSTTISDIFQSDLGFIHPRATIKDLLTHTSGIYDYYDEEKITDFDNYSVEIPWSQLETSTDYLPLFKSKKMKFKPLERVSYSNGGYVFLGMIIEKMTGRLYRDYLSENIFIPSGMQSTGFYAFNALPPNTAFGYIRSDSGLKTNIFQLPIRGGGDGGLYTNSADMLGFWTKLFASEIIPGTLLSDLIQKEVEIWKGQDYGLGIYISKFGKYDSYFALGGDSGVGFSSLYVPGIDLNINVFSNKTEGNEAVMDHILKSSHDLL